MVRRKWIGKSVRMFFVCMKDEERSWSALEGSKAALLIRTGVRCEGQGNVLTAASRTPVTSTFCRCADKGPFLDQLVTDPASANHCATCKNVELSARLKQASSRSRQQSSDRQDRRAPTKSQTYDNNEDYRIF
jgi:hypothetical protein